MLCGVLGHRECPYHLATSAGQERGCVSLDTPLSLTSPYPIHHLGLNVPSLPCHLLSGLDNRNICQGGLSYGNKQT